MSTYKLHDAFDMAIQLERNGHAFDTAAAGYADDDIAKALLTERADWEREHEKLFKLMRDEVAATARRRSHPKPPPMSRMSSTARSSSIATRPCTS